MQKGRKSNKSELWNHLSYRGLTFSRLAAKLSEMIAKFLRYLDILCFLGDTLVVALASAGCELKISPCCLDNLCKSDELNYANRTPHAAQGSNLGVFPLVKHT